MSKIKSLLIYNSNIANKNKENYNIADTINYYCNMANIYSYDYTIDFSSIDNTLKDLDTKEFDVVYIKDSLTLNYLDLIGIELAYHIRFTQKYKYIPIVILSDLDGFTLSKLTTKSQILLTKNTFLNQAPKAFPLFDESNYKEEFLDKITVEQPKDTSGTHGIANKWSIYRWAEFLKVDTNATKINKSKIEEILYFKYLKAKYKTIDKTKVEEIKKLSNDGKVLFIDDEWDKGWSDVLKQAFSDLGENNFKTFEYDYQDKTNFNLISIQLKHKDLKEEIENADVVILDLRLIEFDHTHNNIDDYSGVKILKEIHEINAGIQVIMLTATSKSTILDKLYEYKILGYIKKEHPDDTSISTSENINKLVQLVDKGLERKFLKEIYTTKREIENELQNDIFCQYSIKLKRYESFWKKIIVEVEAVFDILDSDRVNRFLYATVSIAVSIESILSIFIPNDREMFFWDQETYECKYNALRCRIKKLFKKLGSNENLDMEVLIKKRNDYIHNEPVVVNQDEIKLWFSKLQKMIEIIKNQPNLKLYDKNDIVNNLKNNFQNR